MGVEPARVVEQALGPVPGVGREAAVLLAGERRHPQARQAALGEAQDVTLAAELEVLLGQLEAVRGPGDRPEALVLGGALGRPR